MKDQQLNEEYEVHQHNNNVGGNGQNNDSGKNK